MARTVYTIMAEHPVVISAALRVRGEMLATDDLLIDGEIEGSVAAPRHEVTVAREATVMADIEARTIVVRGAVRGNLRASEFVEVCATASVEGHILTPGLLVEEGARVNGTVNTERGFAAAEIARYRAHQTGAAS